MLFFLFSDGYIVLENENDVFDFMQRERPEETNTAKNALCEFRGTENIDFLEDLITLEDLRGPVTSAFNDNFDEPYIDNFEDPYMLESNDFTDASFIATLMLKEVFDNSWIVISNKTQQKDSVIVATCMFDIVIVFSSFKTRLLLRNYTV
jgi:hypothetical protein